MYSAPTFKLGRLIQVACKYVIETTAYRQLSMICSALCVCSAVRCVTCGRVHVSVFIHNQRV